MKMKDNAWKFYLKYGWIFYAAVPILIIFSMLLFAQSGGT